MDGHPTGLSRQAFAPGTAPACALGAPASVLAAALDQMQDLVAIFRTEDGVLLYANDPFVQTILPPLGGGAPPALAHLLREAGSSQHLAAALDQVRAGQPWSGRLHLQLPSGGATPFEGSLRPAAARHPEQAFMILRLEDATLEADRERQLREAQRLGALGALAGGVAHDFNNLIGAILGAAELMELHVQPQSSLWKKVEIIRQVCGRARTLTRQILTFGRQGDVAWTPLDFTALTLEVATLLKATLPPNVRVQTELVHGVCVLGDASQLHQVVMNLGINASQAMQPGGGRLSIRLSPVEPGPPAGGAGAQICLTVEDSGCGMDESTLERIFEPFFTTKALGQGTGLGLSVVHGIVQGHGGRLEVHSRPGLGTSFHIFLPRHQERRQGDGDRGSTVSRIEPFEARETSWGPPPGGSTLGTG